MRALTDALLAALALLVAIAVVGDEVSHFIDAMVPPLCAVIVAVVVARLAWLYTSRW
jgi:uncharacterized membrane protein